MAIIIRGIRKHEQVRIADIRGEFAVLETGKPIRLGMLEMTGAEKKITAERFCDTETFKLHYDLGWFEQTGRFKKHHWASR